MFHGRLGTRGTNLLHVGCSSGTSGSFVLLRMIQINATTSQMRAIGKRITGVRLAGVFCFRLRAR